MYCCALLVLMMISRFFSGQENTFEIMQFCALLTVSLENKQFKAFILYLHLSLIRKAQKTYSGSREVKSFYISIGW